MRSAAHDRRGDARILRGVDRAGDVVHYGRELVSEQRTGGRRGNGDRQLERALPVEGVRDPISRRHCRRGAEREDVARARAVARERERGWARDGHEVGAGVDHSDGVRRIEAVHAEIAKRLRAARDALTVLHDELGHARVEQARRILRVVVDVDLQVVAPRAGARRGDVEHVGQRRGTQRDRRRHRALRDTHDVGFAAAVLEEMLDAVAERTVDREPPERALEVGEAEDVLRLVHRAARGEPDERRDRRATPVSVWTPLGISSMYTPGYVGATGISPPEAAWTSWTVDSVARWCERQ